MPRRETVLDHALAGPLPLLQEDQEIGHLLSVRPLVELPDDVGADLAGGGQDPKEIPTRRWSERVSEASRILPKHRGASVSAAWRPGELLRTPDRLRGGSVLRAVLVGMLRESDECRQDDTPSVSTDIEGVRQTTYGSVASVFV
jgi:hypothetical protein